MKGKPYTYRLVHKSSQRVYIGVRWGNWKEAAADLKYQYTSSSKEVNSIIKEDGLDAFTWEVLEEFETADEALVAEQLEVQRLLESGMLLGKELINKTMPGAGSTEYILNETAEDRRKRGEAIRIGLIKAHADPIKSARYREGARRFNRNNPGFFVGKNWNSPEKINSEHSQAIAKRHKEAVAKANRDPDKNRRIQEKRKETFKDPEVRRKHREAIIEACKSPERSAKISASRKGQHLKQKGLLVTPHGTFEGIEEAAIALNISPNTVRGRYSRNKQKPKDQRDYYYENDPDAAEPSKKRDPNSPQAKRAQEKAFAKNGWFITPTGRYKSPSHAADITGEAVYTYDYLLKRDRKRPVAEREYYYEKEDPRIILCDEPISSLDPGSARHLRVTN